MILKVGVYVQNNAGGWETLSLPDTYLTMHNGGVSFRLPGNARYRITLDGGSFYCITADTTQGELSPRFYLEVS
jgi:hypothetical protein